VFPQSLRTRRSRTWHALRGLREHNTEFGKDELPLPGPTIRWIHHSVLYRTHRKGGLSMSVEENKAIARRFRGSLEPAQHRCVR